MVDRDVKVHIVELAISINVRRDLVSSTLFNSYLLNDLSEA